MMSTVTSTQVAVKYRRNVGSLSIDMSADKRTTTLGRHINRHIDWVSVDISTDARPICCPIYQTTHLGRHIDRHSTDMSADISINTRLISVDISVNMSTDMSVEGCTKYTWSVGDRCLIKKPRGAAWPNRLIHVKTRSDNFSELFVYK